MNDEQKDVSLIYPLIKVNFATTVFENGKIITKECEEVLDLARLRKHGARENLSKLLSEFIEYAETPLAEKRELLN